MSTPNGRIVSTDLSSYFTPPAKYILVPRLAISLDALDKRGKTHYALMTAPDPICCVSNDTGTTYIVAKARAAGRNISVIELDYPDPDPAVTKAADVDEGSLKIWRGEWNKFKDSQELLATKDKKFRTVVWDTGTSLWKLCLLAHFGKLKKIPQHLREETNSAFSYIFFKLYKARPDLNMILLHQLKKEYKPDAKGDGQWTGNYERDGFNKIGFHVDLTIRAGWDQVQHGFYTEMGEVTRYGAELIGKKWRNEDSSFANLAMDIFPETELEPEYWGVR